MEAQVNGVKLYYRESGSPELPALLLVHGFPLDSGIWEAQLEGLADRAHVIAPDLRGHGQSDVPPGPYTMDQYADDLAALLDSAGVKKAVVAGLSMGGYVTLAFWRRHPSQVAGLALIDSRAAADTSEGRMSRTEMMDRVAQGGSGILVDELLPRLLSPENLTDERITGPLREVILRQPAQGMIGALGAMRDREDNTPALATITVPTIAVSGEHDMLIPPEVAVTMAKEIPDARSVLIVNAGHMTPMENPAELNMALGELLSIARF
jgi:pimeloyl-ACP methyl ester carboxylesterase